mmetsp:Transcript_5983/g.26454  ORF Transcript_5983/g.26454 Transcript_5983/m.26454 type:complete len:252 (+) Transcript_5983:662-1417(+)
MASDTSRNQKSKTTRTSEKTPSAVAISPRRVSATRNPACVAAAASENQSPLHAAAGAHRLTRIQRGRAAAGNAQLRAPVPAKCAATSAPRTAPKRAACTSPSNVPPTTTAPRRSATHEAAPETTCAAKAVRWAIASFASAAAVFVGDGAAHHREGPNPAGKRCGGTRLAAKRPALPGSAKPPYGSTAPSSSPPTMRRGARLGRMSATAVMCAGSCASASASACAMRLVHSVGESVAATTPHGVGLNRANAR